MVSDLGEATGVLLICKGSLRGEGVSRVNYQDFLDWHDRCIVHRGASTQDQNGGPAHDRRAPMISRAAGDCITAVRGNTDPTLTVSARATASGDGGGLAERNS